MLWLYTSIQLTQESSCIDYHLKLIDMPQKTRNQTNSLPRSSAQESLFTGNRASGSAPEEDSNASTTQNEAFSMLDTPQVRPLSTFNGDRSTEKQAVRLLLLVIQIISFIAKVMHPSTSFPQINDIEGSVRKQVASNE